MAFQYRNPDGTVIPAGNASDTTSGIEGANIPVLIGNILLEVTIAELLKLTPNELSEVDRNLLNRVAAYLVDFTLVSQEVWNTATDAQLTVLDPNDAAATQAIQRLAAGSVPTLTGWAAEATTTENRVIVVRIPLATNAEDYRIHAVQGSTTTDQRLQYVSERARNSQYKFISTLSTERAGTFTAQHHGVVHHTEFDGNIGARGIGQVQALIDALATSIMARLLPDPSGSIVGYVPKVNSDRDGFVLGADQVGTGGGGGLTQQEKQIIQTLQAKTADLLLQTSETWALATDAQFVTLANNDAAVGRLLSNQVPTGIADGAWTNDQTTTQNRIVIVRVPMNAQIVDYRLLFGDNDPIRLDSYALYATGSQYAYYASTAITNLQLSPPGRIRLQYHGASAHTKYIGALGEDYVTEQEFRDRAIHTPDRGDTLPVHLPPQGTFVLQKTSHWSDKLYAFYPASRDIVISGQTYADYGTIEIPLSSDWTVFEDSDNANPAIFSTTRVAGIVMRWKEGTTERWQPKVILDRALFPSSGGSYDYSGLSIRMAFTNAGHYGSYHDARLLNSAFDADGDVTNGTVTEIVAGGRTYVCFVPDNRNFNWNTFLYNAVQNNAELAFQILKSASASPIFPPTDPQFLSDDPATPWVDGNEFETGLYEGDANGHPQARVLPPLEEWNSLLARTIPYFSGTGPDPRAGVDGQFWSNLRTGEVYQKQSGSWVLIADIVLQAELNAALAGISGGDVENWDDIPRNTSITLGKLVTDDNLFFISWQAHTKGVTKPAADTGNWRLISNYIGGWRSGTYPEGVLVFRGGNFYVSTRNIVPGNPSPTGTNGDDYWVQLDVQAEPARYIELSINSGVTIPDTSATAAPLTFSSTLLQNVNATGFLARNSAGNGITLKAGIYEINTHLVINASTANKRCTITIEIHDGTNVISTKEYIDYIRNLNLAIQSIDSFHKINLTTDKTIQLRAKITAKEDGTAIPLTTNSGVVTISRI